MAKAASTKAEPLAPESIPAERWDALAQSTGADISAVGSVVMAVAAFRSEFPALSARSMADYMAAHYAEGALSHTTIAQHSRLCETLDAAIAPAMRSAELYGMARSVLGTVRYSWERWETALRWESVTASTEHDGERSALAARLIRETFAASQDAANRAEAEAERTAQREAAKAEREAAKATAEATAEAEREAAIAEATAEAVSRAESAEAEAATLRGSIILPGSPEGWDALSRLLGEFLPFAGDMPRHTAAALAALMAAVPPSAPAPAPAPRKRSTSKPRELAAA